MIQSKSGLDSQIHSHKAFQEFNNTEILSILGIDAEGVIVYATRAELNLTGYSLEEYLGSVVSVHYSEAEQIIKSIALGKELYNIESTLLCKDGSLRFVLLSSRNLQDDEGLNITYLFVRDVTLYKKNENLLSYLNTAAEVLAEARDTEDALNKISSLIVPKFANWFTIDIFKDGQLELLKLAHEDPEYIKIGLKYREMYPLDLESDSGTAMVLRTGQASFVPVITDEMIDHVVPDRERRATLKALGLKSVIAVAMFNKEVITGVVSFVSSVPGKPYDESDLRFAQNFANHIGLALENARLNEEALAEIDRRRQIETELRKTQLQLNWALSSGLIGTWIRDLENNVLFADESISQIFDLEYTPEGVDPYKFISRIHPDDLQLSELKRKEALEQGTDYEAEYRILKDDGSIKWVFARGKTECDAEGKPIRFAGVVGDMSERKKAEQALKESEERFRLMAEAMPQKIFITDSDSKMIYLSPQWEKFTGYTMEEIHQLTLAHFIHPDDLEENLNRWRKALETGHEFEYEHRFRAKDGKYYWHLTRALSLVDGGGNKIWIGSITDIDEQKKNEHKKDEFISIASHELKTPITSLRGYLQILAKLAEKEGNHSINDLVGKTYRQAQKLSALISDLLDVSKMQAGKMNYNFAEFDFAEVVDDAIVDASNSYPSHKIIVKDLPNFNLYGDKHRLEQVLSNLLNNAAKYSPEATEIILAVSASDEMLTVSVKDYGVGIPEEKSRFIFNRFFRVEDTSYKFSGLGIGLYISQEIIKRHKGKLWFNSKLGEGSTFTFAIPIKPQ